MPYLQEVIGLSLKQIFLAFFFFYLFISSSLFPRHCDLENILLTEEGKQSQLWGTNEHTETSKRCCIWWQVVRSRLAQNAFLLDDIIPQMFMSNFMCKNFFPLLGRNFLQDKVHNSFLLYHSPKCIVQSVPHTRNSVNTKDWLSVGRSLAWKLPLDESDIMSTERLWNAYFFHKHTSPSPIQPFLQRHFQS